jgi:hypothetical protein
MHRIKGSAPTSLSLLLTGLIFHPVHLGHPGPIPPLAPNSSRAGFRPQRVPPSFHSADPALPALGMEQDAQNKRIGPNQPYPTANSLIFYPVHLVHLVQFLPPVPVVAH